MPTKSASRQRLSPLDSILARTVSAVFPPPDPIIFWFSHHSMIMTRIRVSVKFYNKKT